MMSLLLLVGAGALLAQEAWFPFAMPTLEAEEGVTNLSAWNEAPAGAAGFVTVKDGHFVDGSGRRIRFFGTNLCFGACYPSHQSAERLAARLAGLGVNLVRLHHTDTQPFPRGIWDPADKTRRTFHPEALDRIDYLIAQLIRHGIYVNVNLHVGRSPHENDPAPEAASLPKYGKGVDNFWRPLIDIQKWYAKALLDRVNPYTGRKLTAEPGIAFVEISNEDSLITLLRDGGLDALPKPYQDYLDERWNAWLRERYGTTDKLRTAWAGGEVPLGQELARNGDFSAGMEGWGGEGIKPCEMTTQLTNEGPEGSPALKVTITHTDEVTWHGQVHYKPIPVRAGQPYTVTLWLRAEPARTLSVNAMMAHEPWRRLGLDQRLSIGPQWRQYTLSFRATEDEENARVTVSGLAAAEGTIWVARLSVREGGVIGLPEGQTIEQNNVARISPSQFAGRTNAASRDQCLFYLDLERAYWQEMYDYLKKQLHTQALVTGTQITYSPVYTQEMMDYIDAHSYWQHPAFPGTPWDSRNWYVRNISMVASPPGTLGRLISHRIAGKPYTVSEYNHPAPNQYGGEAFIFLAAYAALQDWDAIYSFNFTSRDEWEDNRVRGYFEVGSHPVQLVTFPAAAAMCRRGDVSQAKNLVTAAADISDAVAAVQQGYTSINTSVLGVSDSDMLTRRVALRWGEQADVPRAPAPASGTKRFVSDTDELVWDAGEQGREVFLIRAPRTKALVGFCCEREYDLGHNVRITVGQNSLAWAAVTLTQLAGERIGEPGDLLVTAGAAYRNPSWGWQDLGQSRVTLGPNWGQGPVEVEGVSAQLILPVAPTRVRVWALDERGHPKQPLEVRSAQEHTLVELSPQYRTLWYHVSVSK